MRNRFGGEFGFAISDDNKAGIAHIVTSFIRLRDEGYVPDRDLIAVFTADEETSSDSIKYLVRDRRDLVDSAFAINASSACMLSGSSVNARR